MDRCAGGVAGGCYQRRTIATCAFCLGRVSKVRAFFLLRSLFGGADVAWRAFHPGLPIAPDLIEYPLRLPPGLPQVLMANTVSLLPGTLSAELDQSVLKIHVLDNQRGVLAELEAVEQSVPRMFGTSLKLSGGGE